MGEDFYFAYDYDETSGTASRLYRRIDEQFQRYIPQNRLWESAPEQCCIYIGEDTFYDEITEEQAKQIIKNWN